MAGDALAPLPHPRPWTKEGWRWRGRLEIPRHAHPLVRRLFREMNAQEMTMTELAEQGGLRRCSISQWGRKNHPRIDQMEAALNVLGLRLAIVPQAAQR